MAAPVSPSADELLATTLLAAAVAHTFAAHFFNHLASRFRPGSIGENAFHLLGEVEVVFGLWAGVLLLGIALLSGPSHAAGYANGLGFGEPLFVFAIMVVASSRPVLHSAAGLIVGSARPWRSERAVYFSCLFLGPLLGSLITEPAAMTVTALILRDRYLGARPTSERFRYATLATLFVNVSIGGAITPYAAPPVLMVAAKWGWGIREMASLFGWKVILASAINAGLATLVAGRELVRGKQAVTRRLPSWLVLLHLLILAGIVLSSHSPVIFIGLLLFFLGVVTVTREYQGELKLRESLLVGFFLAGLVVLGGLQSWWLEPILRQLDSGALFFGTTALTAIVDNAALTYLGSQVQPVSEGYRYFLLAGAIAGGGLTVIANAPNPAGYSILQGSFKEDGIGAWKLFLAALPPTLVALACLGLLR